MNHGSIFFAFADSPIAAKEVRQKIETRLVALDTSNYALSIDDIGRITETVVNEVYANRLGAMPLQLLIAGAEWNMVEFKRMPPDRPFEDPTWKRMTPEMWRDLRLKPKKRLQRRHNSYQSKIAKLFHWPDEALL